MSSLQNETPFNGDENKIEKSQEHSNQSFGTTQPVEVQTEEVPLTYECIHWMPEDESKLDLGYHDKIGMIYKGIFWGSVITIVLSFFNALAQFNNQGLLVAILLLVPNMTLGILGIIGAQGIEKRKPNSIFLCLVFSWICTITNAISIISTLAFGAFPGIFPILWLMYGIAVICALYGSDDVKLIFPKKYRKISILDIALSFVCIFFEAIMLFLAIIGLIIQ
jgi:hypothetical protein